MRESQLNTEVHCLADLITVEYEFSTVIYLEFRLFAIYVSCLERFMKLKITLKIFF